MQFNDVKCPHGTSTEYYNVEHGTWQPWYCSKCLNFSGGEMERTVAAEMTVRGVHLMDKKQDWEEDKFVVEAREGEDRLGASLVFISDDADLVPGTKIRVLIESAE